MQTNKTHPRLRRSDRRGLQGEGKRGRGRVPAASPEEVSGRSPLAPVDAREASGVPFRGGPLPPPPPTACPCPGQRVGPVPPERCSPEPATPGTGGGEGPPSQLAVLPPSRVAEGRGWDRRTREMQTNKTHPRLRRSDQREPRGEGKRLRGHLAPGRKLSRTPHPWALQTATAPVVSTRERRRAHRRIGEVLTIPGIPGIPPSDHRGPRREAKREETLPPRRGGLRGVTPRRGLTGEPRRHLSRVRGGGGHPAPARRGPTARGQSFPQRQRQKRRKFFPRLRASFWGTWPGAGLASPTPSRGPASGLRGDVFGSSIGQLGTSPAPVEGTTPVSLPWTHCQNNFKKYPL